MNDNQVAGIALAPRLDAMNARIAELAAANSETRAMVQRLQGGAGTLENLSLISAWTRTDSPSVSPGTVISVSSLPTFVGQGQLLLAGQGITISRISNSPYLEIAGGGQTLYDYVVDSAGQGTHTTVRAMMADFLADVQANGNIVRSCWLRRDDTDRNIDWSLSSGSTPVGTLVIDGAGAPDNQGTSYNQRASLVFNNSSPANGDAYFKSSAGGQLPNLIFRNIGIKNGSSTNATYFIFFTQTSPGTSQGEVHFENVYFNMSGSNSAVVANANSNSSMDVVFRGCTGTIVAALHNGDSTDASNGKGFNTITFSGNQLTMDKMFRGGCGCDSLTIQNSIMTVSTWLFHFASGNVFQNIDMGDCRFTYTGTGTFCSTTDSQIGTREIVLRSIRYQQNSSTAVPFNFSGTGSGTDTIFVDNLFMRNYSGTAGTALTIGGSFDQVTVGVVQSFGFTTTTSASGATSGLSHATLTNLVAPADDHTQYLLVAGTRALTGNWNPGSFTIGNFDFIARPLDLRVADANQLFGQGYSLTPANYGYTTQGASGLAFNNKDEALKVTLNAGTYTSISAYVKVDVGGKTTSAALYDGTKTLVARTPTNTSITNAFTWLTWTFSTPQTLAAGTYYLAFEANVSFRTFTIAYDNTGVLGDSYTGATFQSNPLAGGADDTKKLSIYITGIAAGYNPRLQFDANDYLDYDRSANQFNFKIGSTSVLELTATALNIPSLYAELTEITAPAAPAANKVRLYAKDNAGTSALYYKDDSGAEIGPLGSGSGVTSIARTMLLMARGIV